MAYHHFAAVDDVSRELVKYLKPGGTLAVADIAHVAEQPGDRDCDGGAPPPLPIMAGHEHIVAHTRGFSEEDIRGGVRRCRARERVLRTVHLGQTAGTRRALLPRHRYEAGRSRGGSIGKVYMYDPLMMMCFTVQQQIRQNEFHLQSCVLSELERPPEPLAHDRVQIIPDFTVRPPPPHADHLDADILPRLGLLVPLIRLLPHRPPPPQQRAPPPHDADRTPRAHDAPHVRAIHRRRRPRVSPAQPRALRLRKARAPRWRGRYVLVRALRR